MRIRARSYLGHCVSFVWKRGLFDSQTLKNDQRSKFVFCFRLFIPIFIDVSAGDLDMRNDAGEGENGEPAAQTTKVSCTFCNGDGTKL
jgi:hypothetical protein